MLRAFFIALSKMSWAQRVLTNSRLVSRMVLRFVAGETIDDAVLAVQQLNQAGLNATLDHLGEDTHTPADAQIAVEEILTTLDVIQAQALRANVSLKLSQIGLSIDRELCQANLEIILKKAQETHNFVRIDMEDSSLTDATISVYRRIRERGFLNVGIVLQAYLYRTEDDLRELGTLKSTYRLCKGAYNESARVAFPKKADVDRNYDHLVSLLFQQVKEAEFPTISEDGRFPAIPALATHDEERIQIAIQWMDKLQIPQECMEFQMLYGIRRELQQSLADAGYPVRVYVPYGTHWYRYFMRRLAERPANVWFLLSNTFKR